MAATANSTRPITMLPITTAISINTSGIAPIIIIDLPTDAGELSFAFSLGAAVAAASSAGASSSLLSLFNIIPSTYVSVTSDLSESCPHN